MDTMNKVSLKKLGIFGLVIISVVGGVFLSVKLAFFLMPFLIAFALSSLMEPLIRVLDSKLRIKRKFSAPIILLLLLAIIVTLVVLGVLRLIEEIKWLIASAPGFFSNLYTKISELMIKGEEYIEWLPVEITDNLGVIISNLSNTVTNFGKALVKGAFVTAISLPEAIIFTIITILATYFMAKDRHRIASVIRHHLPATWVNRILTLKKDLFMAIFGYLRAALIMMVITFTELFIGLSIIQEKYALLLAFLIRPHRRAPGARRRRRSDTMVHLFIYCRRYQDGRIGHNPVFCRAGRTPDRRTEGGRPADRRTPAADAAGDVHRPPYDRICWPDTRSDNVYTHP